MDFGTEALKLHEANKGKLAVDSKIHIKTGQDLSTAYTPGVAAPCVEIYKDKSAVWRYTAKSNLVAVVSDGSAVLGIGDIGALAAIPVMEGKAVLFKEFADVDAFPICLDTKNPDEIIKIVENIAPCFGGINLEDIASPKCFYIEKILDEKLDIPVFHDDQHGTAIVVLAALINALKFVKKDIAKIRVVLNGPGSAGTAIIRMLIDAGVNDITACDEGGIISEKRTGLTEHKRLLCKITNKRGLDGNLEDALKESDVFIGVSVADVLSERMIGSMAPSPVIFAMANPNPEISYERAIKAGAAVVGTGRSDMPNQINNVLAFPGIFRGALDVGAKSINKEMKLAAAYAIAGTIDDKKLRADYIIPSALDKNVAYDVASAVKKAAIKSGVCRNEN